MKSHFLLGGIYPSVRNFKITHIPPVNACKTSYLTRSPKNSALSFAICTKLKTWFLNGQCIRMPSCLEGGLRCIKYKEIKGFPSKVAGLKHEVYFLIASPTIREATLLKTTIFSWNITLGMCLSIVLGWRRENFDW